ncbi:MAG: hypothetical protein HY815_06780 [Candidatus Riflebacteria bacterium]|nr:hypothetical protein [Candidatus Riflebacteria bacterium]
METILRVCMLDNLGRLADPGLYRGASRGSIRQIVDLIGACRPGEGDLRKMFLSGSTEAAEAVGPFLFNRRGLSTHGWLGVHLAVPADPGERGLWVETLRERVHERMTRLARALDLPEREARKRIAEIDEEVTSTGRLIATIGAAALTPFSASARAWLASALAESQGHVRYGEIHRRWLTAKEALAALASSLEAQLQNRDRSR